MSTALRNCTGFLLYLLSLCAIVGCGDAAAESDERLGQAAFADTAGCGSPVQTYTSCTTPGEDCVLTSPDATYTTSGCADSYAVYPENAGGRPLLPWAVWAEALPTTSTECSQAKVRLGIHHKNSGDFLWNWQGPYVYTGLWFNGHCSLAPSPPHFGNGGGEANYDFYRIAGEAYLDNAGVITKKKVTVGVLLD